MVSFSYRMWFLAILTILMNSACTPDAGPKQIAEFVLKNTEITVLESSQPATILGSIDMVLNDEIVITSIDVEGDIEGQIVIDNQGRISLAQGFAFDYESKIEFLFTVTVNIDGRAPTTATLKINIEDVYSHIPLDLNDTELDIDERSVEGTFVGRVNITPSEAPTATVFELTGEGSANFTIDLDGIIRVSSRALIAFTEQQSFALAAQATNDVGLSNVADITIAVNDVELVPLLADTNLEVNVHAPIGSLVGQLTIVDQGDSLITEYEISGVNAELFDIDLSGLVTVKQAGAFSDEITPVYYIKIKARNDQGLSHAVMLSIQVTDDFAPILNKHIVATDADTYDFFGNAVSFLDDKLIVAAEKADHETDSYTHSSDGAIYLFDGVVDGTLAENIVNISDSSARTNNYFGSDLSTIEHSVHGKLLAVGVDGYDYCGGDIVFYKQFDSGLFTDVLNICIDNNIRGDNVGIGNQVALTENYILAGVSSGTSAFLFHYDNLGQWNSESSWLDTVTPEGLTYKDGFGVALSASGDYFVASAYRENNDQGAAYVYYFDALTKKAQQIARIEADDKQESDFFGSDVSIDGNKIVVSNSRGKLYLFELRTSSGNEGTYSQVVQLDTVKNSDHGSIVGAGSNVVIKGNTVVAGLENDDLINAPMAGSVHIYSIEEGQFNFVHRLESDVPEGGAYFGSSLAFDGRFLAVGATGEDNGYSATGGAYLFDLKPDLKPKITNFDSNITVKNNADIDNVFSFEAESANGGPFTYAVSGIDGALFTMNGNQLQALYPFSFSNPSDANADNQYQLIISVSDSQNNIQEYSLNLSVTEYFILYHQATVTSSIAGSNFKDFAYDVISDGVHLVALEHRVDTADTVVHLYLKNDDGSIELKDSLYAPVGIINGTHREIGRAHQTALGNGYLAVTSLLSPVNSFDHDEINSVYLYKINDDHEFDSPVILQRDTHESFQRINALDMVEDILFVSLGSYNQSGSPAVDEPWKQVVYKFDGDGSINRAYTHESVSATASITASDDAYVRCINLQGCDVYNLKNVGGAPELITSIDSSSIGNFFALHKDFVITKAVGEEQNLNFYHINSGFQRLDFIDTLTMDASITESGFIGYKTYSVDDYLVYVDDHKVSMHRLNLGQDGRELLDNIEYLGLIEDERLISFQGSVDDLFAKIGDYFYFGNLYASDLKGEINIFKLDDGI